MRPGIPILSLLLVLAWMASPGSATPGTLPWSAAIANAGTAQRMLASADSRKSGSRLLLESRFHAIRERLDSLWEDSLRVSPRELRRFRSAMHTASKVLAEAGSRLEELRRTEPEREYREWETLRARLERTLFGLDRYLADTEAYWLPAASPEPPPAPAGDGKTL